MGSPDSEVGRKSDEPVHSVEVDNFFISETTITEKQYLSVVGKNPGNFLGDNYPVSNVTWEDAIRFCEKLSLISGKIIDLPSEAEWEYSCRAKKLNAYSFGDTFDSNKVNCDSRSAGGCFAGKPMPVKSYASNGFGLFEMHGNIFEWCKDNYSRRFYKIESKGNPVCLDGSKKVVRGGSFECEPKDCRSASRSSFAKTYKASNVGFRVVIRDGQNAK